MDKLKLAHEWAMRIIEGNMRAADASDLIERAWQYADAMQAEAEKREDKGRPESLCEVDWSAAPSNAEFYLMRCGEAVWSNGFSTICPAPSFGFTGSHIMERPHGF